jgi:hypothetical protein
MVGRNETFEIQHTTSSRSTPIDPRPERHAFTGGQRRRTVEASKKQVLDCLCTIA